MHWYCWKILLKISPEATNVHEMSFVSGIDLTEDKAINRARVGLLYATHEDAAMIAEVVKIVRLGPFATIQEAAIEKEISLV
jgi:hypothetical protein